MTDDRLPRVSVIMPVYNHEAFVWSACESVLVQNYPNLELICVDDGSSDNSGDLLASLAQAWPEERFSFVRTSNAGAHAALNRGISMAQGDVLMFINSDDFYVRERVEKCVRALRGTGDARSAWGFSAVAFIDEHGQGVDPADHGLGVYQEYMFHVAMSAWAAEILPWHNIVLTSGNLVIGRDLLDDVGLFADLRLAHDWDLALRLLAKRDPVILAESLYLYRFHGTNTFRGLDDTVAAHESVRVHRHWAEAVGQMPLGSPARLPFVNRLRARRGLRSAWDGA